MFLSSSFTCVTLPPSSPPTPPPLPPSLPTLPPSLPQSSIHQSRPARLLCGRIELGSTFLWASQNIYIRRRKKNTVSCKEKAPHPLPPLALGIEVSLAGRKVVVGGGGGGGWRSARKGGGGTKDQVVLEECWHEWFPGMGLQKRKNQPT